MKEKSNHQNLTFLVLAIATTFMGINSISFNCNLKKFLSSKKVYERNFEPNKNIQKKIYGDFNYDGLKDYHLVRNDQIIETNYGFKPSDSSDLVLYSTKEGIEQWKTWGQRWNLE